MEFIQWVVVLTLEFGMLYSYKNLIDVKNVFLFIPFPNRRFEYRIKFSKHKQISFDVFSTPYYHVTPTFNTHEFSVINSKILNIEEMKNQIYALTIEEHIQMSYVKTLQFNKFVRK